MIIKARVKSIEMQILKFLYIREVLNKNEAARYLRILKGFEGEVQFDELLEKLITDCLIVNDLLLEWGDKFFQIDSMLIFSDAIYIYDIKNFEGDHYYDHEKFKKRPDIDMNDPCLQLQRCETLLRRLLKQLGYHYPVNASLVFINPQFTMYQAPMDKPIIYPTQLDQLIKNLNARPSKITEHQRRLAEKLNSLHIPKFPYQQPPEYTFESLPKGPFCFQCHSFNVGVMGKNCVCKDCDYEESTTTTVLRAAEEFKCLFPEEKLTVNGIFEFLNALLTKQQIRRALKKIYKLIWVGRWSYYE